MQPSRKRAMFDLAVALHWFTPLNHAEAIKIRLVTDYFSNEMKKITTKQFSLDKGIILLQDSQYIKYMIKLCI